MNIIFLLLIIYFSYNLSIFTLPQSKSKSALKSPVHTSTSASKVTSLIDHIDSLAELIDTRPLCRAGQYLNKYVCEYCVVGKYTSSPNRDSECSICQNDKFYSHSISESCKHCKPGYYKDGAYCIKCFTSNTASVGISSCYQDNYGIFDFSRGLQDLIHTCPLGTTQTSHGCDICQPGYSSGVGSLNECSICPIGTYSNKGAADCTPCDSGYTTMGPGKSVCKYCDIGYYTNFALKIQYTSLMGSIKTRYVCEKCPMFTTTSLISNTHSKAACK